MSGEANNSFGSFLRGRRARLDPAAFGFPAGRRRTPGLRREEVAQRANISATWYTWLEQGRGGAPSADVLNRIAAGLMLTEPEREHLFILGLGRPPEAHYRSNGGVSPRLQRLLESLPNSPAFIKTVTWNVVAWNKAAAAVLTDYGKLPPEQRNILRLMFSDSRVKAVQEDWQNVARYVVGAFRADVARAGTDAETEKLIADLSRSSSEFDALWSDNHVAGHVEGVKRLHHPDIGLIELEFSAFTVDGRPDLGLIVFNPANEETAERISSLIMLTRPR